MTDTELKRVQKALLLILDEIDRICRKYSLKYTLYAGSLLGAIRHKGIIPWDDDIDIAMPRDDYDMFFDICRVELGKDFNIISLEDTQQYGYGFSKIVLAGVRVKKNGWPEGKDIDDLWVDIFPFDKIPDPCLSRCDQRIKNYFYMKILEERYDGIHEKAGILKKACFCLFHVLNKFISSDLLKKQLIQNMMRYDKTDTELISCICGYYGYKRETLPQSVFNELVEYDFEGKKYFGYKEYDRYLKQVYGDYMTLPSKERRHTHDLEVISWGKYQ